VNGSGTRRAALEELRAFVAAQVGFHVDVDSPRVQDVIERRARAYRVTPGQYVSDAKHVRDLDALVRELTVGETYFFRHAEQLAALVEHVLPACLEHAVSTGRRVRIMSAGCASGEEPYTVAIALREAGLDPALFEIVAFDINAASVARARAGGYSEWALRETSPARRAQWFVRDGKQYVVARSIRDAVTFDERNVLEPALWPPSSFDVVLCRNVLMYFTPEAMSRAVTQIAGALRPGGYLLLGYAETLSRHAHGLDVVHSHGAFYYRRGGRPAVVRASSPSWADEIAQASARIERLRASIPSITEPAPPVTDAGVVGVRAAVRAMTLIEAGNYEEAEAACTADGSTDARDVADARYVVALCREAAGDAAAALVHLHHAVALDPAFASAWMRLGIVARRDGDLRMARDALQRAIDAMVREDDERIALFGGGFTRGALGDMCRAQLAVSERGEDGLR
jgi:chemotaxis protein methyltransferase CheR